VLRPEHTAVSRVWCGIATVAVVALAMAGGCDWFNDPSQINLPPDTTITSCPSPLVPPGDDVTIEWEGSDPDGQVVDYQWTFDDTLGGTTVETSMLFEEVEEGTHTFTVASVDNDGEVDASPAECAFTASLGDYVERMVLCELVTTKFCPNCWVADYALVRSLHEFGRENLSVVSYHYSPPPDPLNTEEITDRCDWYYTFFNIATVFPVTIVDGLTADDGAADTTSTIVAYRMQIEARQAIGSPVSIELDGEIDGSRGSVTATLAVSAPGDSITVTRDFVIGDWVLQNLDLVAFVQDDTSAEVLQSARLLTE